MEINALVMLKRELLSLGLVVAAKQAVGRLGLTSWYYADGKGVIHGRVSVSAGDLSIARGEIYKVSAGNTNLFEEAWLKCGMSIEDLDRTPGYVVAISASAGLDMAQPIAVKPGSDTNPYYMGEVPPKRKHCAAANPQVNGD